MAFLGTSGTSGTASQIFSWEMKNAGTTGTDGTKTCFGIGEAVLWIVPQSDGGKRTDVDYRFNRMDDALIQKLLTKKDVVNFVLREGINSDLTRWLSEHTNSDSLG